MNCYKCGKPMADDAKFCMSCGSPAAVQPPAEPVRTAFPYIPPRMEGGNIIIPIGRKFRVRCPDCGNVSDDLKRDESAGYPCPVCKKAYAYAGQLLVYRMGSFHPLYVARQISITVDGCDYGLIQNQDSVRVMLAPGPHVISCDSYGLRNPMQYKIDITPEFNTYAFKFNLIYTGPFTYPGRGTTNEFKQCAPEEIPNI